MRLLLLAAIASSIGATTTYAHGNVVPMNSVCRKFGETLSSDSPQKPYQHIDLLSVFDLKKWRESWIYRNRTQSSDQNKQVLTHIEERLKVVQ